eukprot:306691_1
MTKYERMRRILTDTGIETVSEANVSTYISSISGISGFGQSIAHLPWWVSIVVVVVAVIFICCATYYVGKLKSKEPKSNATEKENLILLLPGIDEISVAIH